MGLFGNLFGNKDVVDEPLNLQREDLMSNPMIQEGLLKVENGCDEVMGSYGSFGVTDSKPIPVNGVTGQICYINRLRSKSGVGFFYHRLGSTSSPVTENPVDKYELVAVDSSEWVDLYLSPYYARRSTYAPVGLSLISWDDMEEVQKMLSKFCTFGSTSFVPDFPLGIVTTLSR